MTQKSTHSQKQQISLLDVVGFYVDLAMFLPRNKAEVPPEFSKLLTRYNVTHAGTDYIRRIDHKHLLDRYERAILAEEGTYYLLRLQFFYIAQILNVTTWQCNVGLDDPRLITNMDVFTFYVGRVEMCLRAFGVSEEYAHKLHYNYVNESERYHRKRTWEYAVRDGSLYPAMMKLMRLNMTKLIVMTDEKLEVIDKYSSKIHKVAAKFYMMLEKDYRYVGIRHFDEL